MQIEQVSEVTDNKKPERQGFEFQVVDWSDPRVFPNFKSKDTLECFFRWGITEKNL